jgi:hypothetical protein
VHIEVRIGGLGELSPMGWLLNGMRFARAIFLIVYMMAL